MLKRYFSPGIGVCMLLSSCFENKQREEPAVIPAEHSSGIIADTLPRSSITFILGKDENVRNPYYSLANEYYRVSNSEKTEMVIDTMISLLEVRNYLLTHPPENGRPWGLINLVTHGNEFVDLSVYISPTGSRVSEESLQKAIADSVIKPLDSLIIDKKTLFNLHGCAVGNHIGLLNYMGIAFGGSKNPARVKASKMFEYYADLSKNKNPEMIKHYYAKVWYAYYKVDEFPGAMTLAEQLKTRYAVDTIDWIEAIQRQFPSDPSETYHLTLNIPVVWEDFYASKKELPDLRTKAKQDNWLEKKTEFLDLISKSRIPREYFRIKFYALVYNRNNDTIYSSKVKGMAGVVCIIKPTLKSNSSQNFNFHPYVPADEDSNFFGFNNINMTEVEF